MFNYSIPVCRGHRSAISIVNVPSTARFLNLHELLDTLSRISDFFEMVLKLEKMSLPILRTLPLSGRQGVRDGAAVR